MWGETIDVFHGNFNVPSTETVTGYRQSLSDSMAKCLGIKCTRPKLEVENAYIFNRASIFHNQKSIRPSLLPVLFRRGLDAGPKRRADQR